jgi:hypothetical protein
MSAQNERKPDVRKPDVRKPDVRKPDERKPDERTALTEALAILRSLTAGAKPNADAAATLRETTRQLTTAMARATAGESALNDLREDAATALSAVRASMGTLAPTQDTVSGAERALLALREAIERQEKAPDRIYVDPTHPATLRHDGEDHACRTLEEAVLAWLHLSEVERKDATIQVNVPNGPAAEIDRLHIEAKYIDDEQR